MKKFLLILLFLLTISGGGYFLYLRNKQKNTGDQSTSGITFKDFFPSGNSQNTGNTPDEQNNGAPENDQEAVVRSRFRQLTKRPIAGYTVFSKTTTIPGVKGGAKTQAQTTTDYFLRYVSRQSGFIYESKNEDTPIQISNIFIPNIYEALFLNNNESVLLRYLQNDDRTISSYIVPIPPQNPDGTRTQKEGVFLPNNITSVAIAPDQKQIAQLTTEKTNGVLTLSDGVNKNRKELLYSPLKEWLIQWQQQKQLFIQTKPAGTVGGFLYSIDTTEKKLRKVLGNISGLTTSVSPNGEYIIFSESTATGIQTNLFNTKTGNTQKLGVSVLPEKCVWLKNSDALCAGSALFPQGTYPDVWYAGLVSFSDQLYRIYTKNNVFDVVYDDTQESFDMTNLQINEDRNLLYFVDKKTGFLWEFSL